MKLSNIIRANKVNVNLGRWQTGHVPKSSFPMSKLRAKNWKFGQEYKSRIVSFDAAGYKCRIWLLLNEKKSIYRARFGVELNGDMVVLCDHEFHSCEPGWHCHLCNDAIDTIEPGVARSHTLRWPQHEHLCSLKNFNVSEVNALSEAATRFRFNAQGSLL